MTIRQHLFGDTDIYAGINPDDWPSDVHGWNDHREHFAKLVTDPKLIVEVGSWKGRSALLLAELFPNAEIVCIDTWLGSKEMWTNRYDPERYGALRLRNGRPELQMEFMANVIRSGKQHQITPFPVPSSIGLAVLEDLEVRPDLIYVDASHEYEDVMDDIRRADRLAHGVLSGDDYGSWPGVTQAVFDTFLAHGIPVTIEGNGFWWVRY